MRGRTIRRLLREEEGFTLSEMLITLVIMLIVLFAVYSIFDTGMRIFSFGNNEVEATQNARLGLEKMERELRQAYKKDAMASQNHLFFTTATPESAMPMPPATAPPTPVAQLTFGNEIIATGTSENRIDCPAGGTCEYITYKLTSTANPANPCATAPCTLRRVNTANSGDDGDSLVEHVIPGGLRFDLLKSDGTAAASESETSKVRITLDVSVDRGIGNAGTQTLTTEVDLRNR